MSQDPYKLVQQEIQTAFQAAEHLRASYLRIRSTARSDSEELIHARKELKGTLEALEADLEELEGSVVYVVGCNHLLFSHLLSVLCLCPPFGRIHALRSLFGRFVRVLCDVVGPDSIVEQTGARMFGLSEQELITRRKYVTTTKDLLKVSRPPFP